jgi:hypothetical protein
MEINGEYRDAGGIFKMGQDALHGSIVKVV